VQCALPINLFNEKFFIYLWFWLIILAGATFANFIGWFKLLFRRIRRNSMAKYLRSMNKLGNSEKEKEMFESFVDSYLHLDGAFVFAILRRNSNYIATSEIVCALWSIFTREFTRSHAQEKAVMIGQPNINSASINMSMVDYDEQPEKVPLTHPHKPTNSMNGSSSAV
jgi:innexin